MADKLRKTHAKNAYCKIGKRGCVFGHIDKFWKGHGGQIKKNACKNTYLIIESIFIPENKRVCFWSY